MTNPAVLITGATGGLGRATAQELARRGYSLVLGGRRREALESECRALESRFGARARPWVAELANLEEVRAAARELDGLPLRGIVANAGVTTTRDVRSADGYELTFAVNVLAHQLLLCLLEGQLVQGARVVIISSGVHEPGNKLARRAGIPVPRWVGAHNLARPDAAAPADRLPPGPQRYSTSKLGNVLQARALQARLRARGRDVDVFAVDPGLMVDTELARELPAPLRLLFRAVGRLATPFVDNMRLSRVSARHVAALIDAPQWSGRGFAYLDGDRVKPPSSDAQRDELADALWRDANELVTLRDDDCALPRA